MYFPVFIKSIKYDAVSHFACIWVSSDYIDKLFSYAFIGARAHYWGYK